MVAVCTGYKYMYSMYWIQVHGSSMYWIHVHVQYILVTSTCTVCTGYKYMVAVCTCLQSVGLLEASIHL